MMARRVVLGGMTGAAVALLGGCSILFPAKYRFRMTVEVQTPRGMKTGSSVYELEAHKTFALTSEEKEGSAGIRGQATIVDLPDGPLFVLMKTKTAGVDLGAAATIAFRPDAQTGRVDDYIAAVRALGWTHGVKAELPRQDWPLMVRFMDMQDPASAELVEPDRAGIRSIKLETTHDSISRGIDDRLPWLKGMKGRYLNGAETARYAGLGLGAGDFSTEIFHD
jgi:hypothetical protein